MSARRQQRAAQAWKAVQGWPSQKSEVKSQLEGLPIQLRQQGLCLVLGQLSGGHSPWLAPLLGWLSEVWPGRAEPRGDSTAAFFDALVLLQPAELRLLEEEAVAFAVDMKLLSRAWT